MRLHRRPPFTVDPLGGALFFGVLAAIGVGQCANIHLLEEEETAVLLEVLPLHRGEPLLLSDGVCAGHAGSEQDHEDAATHWIGLSTKCMLHVRWK